MLESKVFEQVVADRQLIIETGSMAGQANAAVSVRYGDTVVLVTVCFSREARQGVDFLPLTVDYEERLYAAGKIPGGFIRREGRPAEAAILAGRLTDRSIRPLLPKDWRKDVQVVATVLSADQENDPDTLALIGASAVLTLSEVPFAGPLGVVRVGYIKDKLVLNPTLAQLEESQLDLIVASTRTEIVMLEAGARELPEQIIREAIRYAHDANQEIIRLQDNMQQACGKPKLTAANGEARPKAVSLVTPDLALKLAQALGLGRAQREQAFTDLTREMVESLGDTYSEEQILAAFDAGVKAELRKKILEGHRAGGRGLTEIRPLDCRAGILPRTHGSAMFTRGLTQVLTITTLGSAKQEQPLDGLGIEESKRFMHHYNFPPFSTGETKRLGSPGRREIGHGALAERALAPVVPVNEDFPYTIRLVSEVLSSSGSTSMASVCAGSMSMMDAGIPTKAHVAGIAMGLVTGEDGRYAVLTDIEGLEDAYGDMDFKVAGTWDGITAVQMDTKLKGLTLEIVDKTITQAREARLFILDKMYQAIGGSRPEVSRYAPRMYKMTIDPGKIGAVIGAGGKTIKSITSETKTTIDIEDDGTVVIGSPDAESARKAIAIIEGLTKEIEVGTIYTGKVSRIFDFGAMVEILPGKEGLVHISELADYRVGRVEDIVKVGDEVTVKVVGVDNLGRINLSRKAVFEKAGEAGPTPDYPFRKSGAPPRQFPPRSKPFPAERGRGPRGPQR
ncbi:MAG: polyribonucleotide nucleotidyltransferase [Chloroflexi bacterium]|nr:polyribonucleotide nucleotidyltransferase [Chloroflexota bacterium]